MGEDVSDIVERLRDGAEILLLERGGILEHTTLTEAADAIEARDAEIERLRAELAERDARIENQRAQIEGRHQYVGQDYEFRLETLKALLREASKTLIEVVRMPNQEHVADAHNETVRRIRAALGDEPADDATRKKS